MTVWYVASDFNKEYLNYEAGPFKSMIQAIEYKDEHFYHQHFIVVQSYIEVE